MSHEYLVSSLPLLFFGDPPPFSSAAFRARCVGPLGPHELTQLDLVLAGRAGEAVHPFAQSWHRRETQLRDELVHGRASRYAVESSAYARPHRGYDRTVHQIVADALAKTDPLERERVLDHGRWQLLDELALRAPFGLSAVLAFALKLRIAERWAGFSDEAGRQRLAEQLQAAEQVGGAATEQE